MAAGKRAGHNQSTWRAVLRSVFAVDWGQIEIGGAIRCTIGVLIPLVVGIASGAVADGVAGAVGALSAGFASFQGGYRSRASLTVLVAAGMAVSTMAGALAARTTVSAVLVTAVWGGLAGMMVSLGPAGLITGLQWVVAELIVGAIPMTLSQAAVRAAMVMAGGIIQTVLVVSLWPFRTYRFERRAIQAAYFDLASVAAHISSGDVLSPGAITLNNARQALEDPQPFSRTGRLLAFQALVDEAERIRIQITALARHRSRLQDPRSAGALDSLAADAAAALRTIGRAIGRDDDPRLATDFGADLDRDCAELEQAVRTSEGPSWVATELTTVAHALSGQLRSAIQMAAVSSGVPDSGGFGGRELPRRRSSPLRMPLETLSANLSWQSAAFRHAVRLATTLAVATVIYRLTALQHGYWVPLTVLVVLRPDFTSTAVRGASRILGTIAGAALATLLAALLRPDAIGLTVLLGISVFAAYLVVRVNYTMFSITITSFVVFLLAFVKLPELSAVSYRLISTVLGGALAIIAYLLWPTWESRLVGPGLADLLEAQADYSGAVLAVIVDPKGADRRRLGELRSKARRARSNAEASLERMATEPPRATRSVPLSLGRAMSILAAARRFSFAVLTLHSDLPASDVTPSPDVTTLSRGIGGRMRGNAARLRTLVPSARVQVVPAAGAEPPGELAPEPSGERAGEPSGERAADPSHGEQPPTLRELHNAVAQTLESRVASGGREADLIRLLIAETDLMVDSVNTVSEVLGRRPVTSHGRTDSRGG